MSHSRLTTRSSGSMFAPLANRTYRHLYLAQISALTGTGVMTVGLALLAYQLAGDDAGAVLGIALSLRIVAFVLISPLSGLRPPSAAAPGAGGARPAARGHGAPVALRRCCLAGLRADLRDQRRSAGFTPLFQATIPDVLPDEAVYTRALSLSRLAYDLQQLLAPALAGVLLWFLPLAAFFAVNGAAFLISAALVLSVALPGARKATRPEGVLANIGWGIRLYLATPRLRGLLALSMAVAAATAMVIVNTVVYVRDVLGGGDTLVTVAYAASGGGSCSRLCCCRGCSTGSPSGPSCWPAAPSWRAAWLPGRLMPSLAGLLAIWFLIGVGSSLVQTPGGRLLRRSAHEEDRPALFAAQFALSHACWLLRTWSPAWSATRSACSGLSACSVCSWSSRAALRCGYGRPPIPRCSSTSTRRCGTSICTSTTSITGTSTRAGRGPNRTVTRTGMFSDIATASSSTCTISTGRHEGSSPLGGALNARAHPVGRRPHPPRQRWRLPSRRAALGPCRGGRTGTLMLPQVVSIRPSGR